MANNTRKILNEIALAGHRPQGFVPKSEQEINALVQQHLEQIQRIIGGAELHFEESSYNGSDGSLNVPTSNSGEISIFVAAKGVKAPDGVDYSEDGMKEMDFGLDMFQVLDINPNEVMVVGQV
jgi:hypothetical protein